MKKKITNLLTKGYEKLASKDDPLATEIADRKDRCQYKITKRRKQNRIARISRKRNR